MTTTHEQWDRYNGIATDIGTCTDPNCAPGSHAKAIRFWLLTAYDEGRRDALREQREAAK